MLDQVDEHDEVIGVVRRGDANRDPSLIHRSVEVLVLTSRRTLLLQRRAATKDLYPGGLCASASGHVSAGQTYEEAARQELREELGIAPEIEWLGKVLVRAETETEFTSVYLARHDGPYDFSPLETAGGIEVPVSQALDPAYRAGLGIVPALEAGLALVAEQSALRDRFITAVEVDE
jgi:8-oxo-dGTP pyrophosphatase MutT (NUDIX family)